MNKSIQRVRRVGINVPVAITTNSTFVRDVPKSAVTSNYTNTISTRLNTLEAEVADITVAVANNTTTVANLQTSAVNEATYIRNLQLNYTPTSTLLSNTLYYNTVNPTMIGLSDATKLPFNITSLDSTIDISSEIIPIAGGLCFMLPCDSNIYQLTISSELKINTENIPVTSVQSSINYLSGSPYQAATPAIAKLIVYQVNSNGSYLDTNNAAVITNTWSNIITDPTLSGSPPNNFMVFQDPMITGQAGSYYKTVQSNIMQSFNLLPILDSTNAPMGRRLVTIAVTSGYSFSKCILTITKVV